MARVASKVYTRKEVDVSQGINERGMDPTQVNTSIREARKPNTEMSIRENTIDARCYCVLKVLNARGQHLELGKNVRLGVAETLVTLRRNTGVESHSLGTCEALQPSVQALSGRIPTDIRDIEEKIREKLGHLRQEEREVLLPVVNEYIELFCNEQSGVLPCTTKGRHEIRAGNALPIKKNPYRVPYALNDEMKSQLDEMLAKVVITLCASPWAAPVILVPKKSLILH